VLHSLALASLMGVVVMVALHVSAIVRLALP
jgi:hypothetical protein